MGTTITEYGTVSVLTVSDELTGDAVDTFVARAEQCVGHGRRDLIVDVTSMHQIDSTGLEALVDLQDKCDAETGSVKLCGVDPTLAKVLEITRLSRRFEILEDLESAVQSFA